MEGLGGRGLCQTFDNNIVMGLGVCVCVCVCVCVIGASSSVVLDQP